VSTWVDSNPFRRGRFYYLAINDQRLLSQSSWEAMSGGVRLKPLTASHFRQSLKKAQSGEYRAVVFPMNSVEHPQFKVFVEEVVSAGLRPILQVSSELAHRLWAHRAEIVDQPELQFEFILENLPSDLSIMQELLQQKRAYFTVVGLREAPIWKQLDRIPLEFYPELHFYFPYHGQKKKIFTPKQIVELRDFFVKRQKDFVLRPPLGMDLYEPRIEAAREIESEVQPVVQQNLSEHPQLSVVIPAYNNGKYLLNTLRHLETQNIQKDLYEVVVVDDGSSDQTSELILQALAEFKMGITYLYYPRMKPRMMGDSQFRAGLARNLGVRWARGETLLFLDSDIIVPPHFLQRTLELQKKYDVIQWRRDYLTRGVPSTEITYAEIDPAKDCFIPEGGYWHKFYKETETKNWTDLPDYWKYVCTYAFSIKRSLFTDIGWFRKTFCFYGFEDTDLGWRLAQGGYSFYLNNEVVYHLFHETERSEFRNSFLSRQKLLKNTARIFFNNNLAPEIYRVFKYLLRDHLFF
jgi:glycosyltransferase involved in cell wall biosynthesis